MVVASSIDNRTQAVPIITSNGFDPSTTTSLVSRSRTQNRKHLTRSASWSPAAQVEDPNAAAFTFSEDDLIPTDDWAATSARLAAIGPPPPLPGEPAPLQPESPAKTSETSQDSKITISRTLLVSEQQRNQPVPVETNPSRTQQTSGSIPQIPSGLRQVVAEADADHRQHNLHPGEGGTRHGPTNPAVRAMQQEKEDVDRRATLTREKSFRSREPSGMVATLSRSASFFSRKPRDSTTDTQTSSGSVTPTRKRPSGPLLKSFSNTNIPSLARTELPIRPLSMVPPPATGEQASKSATQTVFRRKDELWNAFRALESEYHK